MSDELYLHLVRRDCPLPPGTHVVVYCRDLGGEEQDRSVQQQIDAAAEYCQHHNLVLEHTYIDEAKLSSNTEKRDDLQRLLDDLRSRFKRINDRYKREKLTQERPFGVIFWKSNRLGRDSIDATNIKTDLRLRGITIIDLLTSANTGNAGIDLLIEAFQQWQDEQLLDEISQNSRRGLAQLVGLRDTDPEFLRYNPDWQPTGAYLSLMPGGVPRGFKGERIQIGVYKRKRGRASGEPRIVQRIVPDPDTWDRCRTAWEMRRSGATIGEIHNATHLFKNTNGYDTFFGNRIYTGDLEYGDKTYESFVPALIPKDWFDEEQLRRAERKRKLQGKKVKPEFEPNRVGKEYLLSGLVFCGAVDGEEHPMHIESIPAKKGKRGNYSFFMCTTRKNSRKARCQAGRVSLRALEQAVIGSLMTRVLTRENLQPLAREIAKTVVERNQDVDVRITALENQLDEVQQSLSHLVDAIERMGYAADIQRRYDQRKGEEARLLAELSTLKSMHVTPSKIVGVSDAALDQWIEYIRDALGGGDRGVARRALRQFVEKIVVKNETGTLYYTFPLEDDLYMPSLRSVDLMRLQSNLFFPQVAPLTSSN